MSFPNMQGKSLFFTLKYDVSSKFFTDAFYKIEEVPFYSNLLVLSRMIIEFFRCSIWCIYCDDHIFFSFIGLYGRLQLFLLNVKTIMHSWVNILGYDICVICCLMYFIKHTFIIIMSSRYTGPFIIRKYLSFPSYL